MKTQHLDSLNIVGMYKVVVQDGMNLVGSGYPESVRLTNSNLWESGFAGAGNEAALDRAWSWVVDHYEFIWLVNGVGTPQDWQWMGNNSVNKSLEPGKGYWIQRRGSNPFQWDYIKP